MNAYFDDEDVALVRESRFFDADWYVQTYPDVTLSGLEPAEHYLWFGAPLGRPPSRDFDLRAHGISECDLEASGENPVLYLHRVDAAASDASGRAGSCSFRSHVGPIFDAAVTEARARMRPVGEDEDYDVVAAALDTAHYLLRTPTLIGSSESEPVEHFLRSPAKAGRSPHINFSMRSYLRRYPEMVTSDVHPFVHWLKRGRFAGEIADPAPGLDGMGQVLGMSPAALAFRLGAMRLDLQERLRNGTLGEMFAKAAEIEPLIADTWSETTQPKIAPLATELVTQQMQTMFACHKAADFRPGRLVLVINRPRWGGGPRIEGHIARTLSSRIPAEDIIVVYTDRGGITPPGRFPAGVREIDFASTAADLPIEGAQRVLVELLRSFGADAIVNINSKLLYETLATYGKALADSERIFLCFFCNEERAQGNLVGYPVRYFYRYADLCEGVVTDSEYLMEWFADTYQLDERYRNLVHVFPAPVDPSLPVIESPPKGNLGRRPKIFWAGRFDRQKRLDVLRAVAGLLPDVDFHLYGEAVTNASIEWEFPSNVHLQGTYAHLSNLPLNEADAWLYTSAWDGVPSTLLEVAMTGIPIVGSVAGGTAEVLLPDMSWPVAGANSPEGYVRAIRSILSNPVDARRRALELRRRLAAVRTDAAYREKASILLNKEDLDNV